MSEHSSESLSFYFFVLILLTCMTFSQCSQADSTARIATAVEACNE